MKKLTDLRSIFRCFTLCLMVVAVFPSGCATTDLQSVTKFRQGLSAVQTDSQTILLEFNRFVRDLQLDRAATLASRKESDVAPALDPESFGRWNRAFESLSLYASALETLAGPTEPARVEESLKSLGN